MARERSWRDRKERKAGGCLLRALLAAVVLVLGWAPVPPFGQGPAPAVTLKPGLPGIGRRTPIVVKIDDTGRLTAARLEVIQGNDATLVAERKLTAATSPGPSADPRRWR